MYAAHAASPTISSNARSATFTPLEQRVLRLAASGSERLSTTVEGSLHKISRRIGNFVMARRGGRELADPRLEALRSYAAGVRAGSSAGLPIFYAAGYSSDHVDAVKTFVAAEQRIARGRAPRFDRMMYASGVSLGLASIMGFVVMTGSLLAGV